MIATAPNRGAIEVIRDASSRHDLGRTTEGSLVVHFVNTYGSPAFATFLQARENFLRSMAAYSIVSFILQVKDRHNGNIMLDHAGHIIHIDFGFMLNISPGGEIKFERAPFKLSTEMIQLMGGTPTAEPYVRFVNYVSKGYLAIRPYADDVVALCALFFAQASPASSPAVSASTPATWSQTSPLTRLPPTSAHASTSPTKSRPRWATTGSSAGRTASSSRPGVWWGSWLAGCPSARSSLLDARAPRWCERWLEVGGQGLGAPQRTRPSGPSARGSRLDARSPRWCERWLEVGGQGLGAPHRPPTQPQCAGLAPRRSVPRGGVSGGWRHSVCDEVRRTGLPSSSTPSCCWFDRVWLRSPARSQVELPRRERACSHGPVAAHSCRWNEPATPAL